MTSPIILLRKSTEKDLDTFFLFQVDPAAIHMAAFTPRDPTDKPAYIAKYTKLLQEPSVHMRTILYKDRIAGSISKFELDGHAEITYWIDRSFWGKGIATDALRQFLVLEKMRPIYGRTASDNAGSQKVLQHNGFVHIGRDRGFANARNMEIEESIYRLD